MKEEKNKQSLNEDKTQSGEVTRRDFLVGAGTVAIGGAIGAGMLSGCSSGETVTKTVETTKTVEKTTTIGGSDAITVTSTEQVGAGETVTKTTTLTSTVGSTEPAFEEETTVIKTHSLQCFAFGGELDGVDVKNDKIVRIRPLHYTETGYTEDDLADCMWTISARGKTFSTRMKGTPTYHTLSYKKRVYSPNRIKYPLRRIDWDPDGERNTQNRGISKYKRITWNEATDYIVSEINRVKEAYGPYSILLQGDGHGESKTIHGPHGCHMKALQYYGGYTLSIRNADSWEGYYWGSEHVWGTMAVGAMDPSANVLKDASENTEMIIFQGCDWETTPQGLGSQLSARVAYWFSDLGIKCVHISPELNFMGCVHADKWIPVKPNTDAALLLAVVYTMINENLYDADYVSTHVVGFDGSDDYGNFKAYVMGDVDGVPKTPAWAAPKCGVNEWTIKALARQWGTKKTSTAHNLGGSFVRGPYSHEPARLENIILGLQGLGQPGVHQIIGTCGPPRQEVAQFTAPSVWTGGLFGTPVPQQIPKTLHIHALLEATMDNPMYWWGSTAIWSPVEDQFTKYIYPIDEEDGGAEIHMIWFDNPCHIVCWGDGNSRIKAYRGENVECIVGQHPWLEGDCLFADIILPSNTMFEEDDVLRMGQGVCWGGQLAGFALCRAATTPIGESMSDYEAVGEVAKKLGDDVYEKYTGGMTVEEKLQYGFEHSDLAPYSTWDDFSEKGFVFAPMASGWEDDAAGLIDFYTDPVNNPLGTPSGKLEFTSKRLAEYFPDDDERGPYPKWVVGGPGGSGVGSNWTGPSHDESMEGERCKKYPLLLESNHPRWRVHPQNDDNTWLREIPTCKMKGYDGYMYEPVWIHPVDAAARGIEHGDIVKVYNDRGIELGAAYVTWRMVEGGVHMDHGAHVDMISCAPEDFDNRETKWVNRGGTVNNITPLMGTSKNCWGNATSGFLVEVEKLDPSQMEEWRKAYPEAFARDYDPSCGLKFNAWIEGGEE